MSWIIFFYDRIFVKLTFNNNLKKKQQQTQPQVWFFYCGKLWGLSHFILQGKIAKLVSRKKSPKFIRVKNRISLKLLILIIRKSIIQKPFKAKLWQVGKSSHATSALPNEIDDAWKFRLLVKENGTQCQSHRRRGLEEFKVKVEHSVITDNLCIAHANFSLAISTADQNLPCRQI